MEKCFGFRNYKCQVLYNDACKGCDNKCKFYATDAQMVEARHQANCHISTLWPTKQVDIADKYYGGKMPWRNGGY